MNYKSITKRGRLMNTFTINNTTYEVIISEHAIQRMQQRKLDELQVLSAIYALGGKRIDEYNNSNRDFAVVDKYHKLAIIATIENQQVVIISLLNSSDCWLKKGTDVINI